MIVYVESNFPLELARRQEEVAQAEDLLKLAETGRIQLTFPAIALTEPFSTLLRYADDRSGVLQKLEHQLKDLARSQSHQSLVANMSNVVAALTQIRRDEMDFLKDAVDRMLNVGRSIPLTTAVFGAARIAETQHDLAPQDAVVFSSIMGDLATLGNTPAASCFLSKNSRDFWVTRNALASHNCRYVSKFSAGLPLSAQRSRQMRVEVTDKMIQQN